MTNPIPYRQAAVKYWERRRIAYNIALFPPAMLGYLPYVAVSAGVGDRHHLGIMAIFALFLISAIGANICYSFGYALEFFLATDNPESVWLRWGRSVTVIMGALFAVFLSVIGGHNIAVMDYYG